MKLDNEFREAFLKALLQNKDEFKNDCIKMLEASIDSCFRTMVDNISSFQLPYKLDLESAKARIKSSLDLNNNPDLKLRTSLDNDFSQNEIRFLIPLKEQPIFNSPAELHYRIERKRLEYDCEREFWLDQSRESFYRKISNFNCFNDITIKPEELKKYERAIQDVYNIDEWIDYISHLIEYSFPEFQYSEQYSSTKIQRYFKTLENKMLLGIEFNTSFFKRALKTGNLDLPYYFNLILVNGQMPKSIPVGAYITAYNENILSLGILGNPFFYQPCAPLIGYQAMEMHFNIDQPEAFIWKYKREFKKNSDGSYTIIHPKEYGEKLKRHAFFYFEALKFSSDIYVKYIEISITGKTYG